MELAQLNVTATLICVDESEEALAVARSNARKHGLDNVSFVVSSWFDALGPSTTRNDRPHRRQSAVRRRHRIRNARSGAASRTARRTRATTQSSARDSPTWRRLFATRPSGSRVTVSLYVNMEILQREATLQTAHETSSRTSWTSTTSLVSTIPGGPTLMARLTQG